MIDFKPFAAAVRAGVTPSTKPMEQMLGKEQEDEARDHYSFIRDVTPRRVGFVFSREKNAGCSPDSLVGEDGGLEIKSAAAHIQIERIERGDLPPEHKAQVQGGMWICERAWWDFMSFCPGIKPHIIRVQRDDEYIDNLAKAVARFNEELAAAVERIRPRTAA